MILCSFFPVSPTSIHPMNRNRNNNRSRCQGILRSGEQCRYRSKPDQPYCGIHLKNHPPIQQIPIQHVISARASAEKNKQRRDAQEERDPETYNLRTLPLPHPPINSEEKVSPHQCSAVACSRRHDRGSKYCSQHKDQYRFEKPEECPICMERMGSQEIPLHCAHWVCHACVQKLAKEECPICRSPLNVSYRDRASIHSNRQRYRQQDIEDQERQLQEEQERERERRHERYHISLHDIAWMRLLQTYGIIY